MVRRQGIALAGAAALIFASAAAAQQPTPEPVKRPIGVSPESAQAQAARERAARDEAARARAAAAAEAARSAPVPRSQVPFGVGEQARYRVSYNVVGRVGTGTMSIVGVDTIRGRPAYRAVFTLRGRFLLAQVNNRFETWLDVGRIFSHRFEQQTHEVNFRRNRTREFMPAQMRWTGQTNGRQESGTLATSEPLDDTSFLYFVRTQDLQVGYEYTFDRYYNPDGNPVRLRVLRRETVRVPAGTFETIVLQPIIKTSGLFAEGGEAEVYYNEASPRQLVMLRAKVSFGTLQLQLEEFTPSPRPGR
jgi:hypothetical protein